MVIGSFCLVLHGHMPYVLRHGTWPHGEDWLYEAAAEVYLPLLAVIDECQYLKGNPRLTIGLTPILLEQLAHEDFKRGFETYLQNRITQARSDQSDFKRLGESHLAHLATRWEQFYLALAEQFISMDRNIPKAFVQRVAGGLIQLLTSSATHAYLPLLLEDSSIRAQVRAGVSSSKQILGFTPKGMWLPEGAYRPGGPWKPAIQWGQGGYRIGIDRLIADEGITHFFVDDHLGMNGPIDRLGNGGFQKMAEPQEGLDSNGYTSYSPHEPVWVGGDSSARRTIAAFTRDPHICKQVWCGISGYPADGTYLEFHKRQGEKRGLRYWKVTDRSLDLGGKDCYYPDDVPGKIYEHAQHFCNQIKNRLYEHRRQTGRHGVVVACFDAELFGHWWFEGPRFLRDVLLRLNADPEIELCTAEGYMEKHPPQKEMTLPEGSWGDGGDNRVWANEKVGWIWEMEYRCETLFGKLTYHLPWRKNPELCQILQKAGRELLLLQASDWPFIITQRQAADYGIKRFVQHVSRFESLTDIAEKLAADSKYIDKLTEIERSELQDAEVHDVVFPHIDLNWWNT